MNIKSYNKALCQQCIKAFNFAFTTNLEEPQTYYCYDTDNVKYRVTASPGKVILLFNCSDLDNLWQYGGKHMSATYYRYIDVNRIQQNHTSYIQLKLDNSILEKINGQFKEKQSTGIITGKGKFDAIFAYLAKKFASIKRHFFAAPYQMMLQAVLANHKNNQGPSLPNLSYFPRHDQRQKIWIAFQKKQFTVYFGISFEDRFQQQLGRVLFSELSDAKKHVQGCPIVSVNESELPRFLIDSFPQQKNSKYSFANGIISFTISGQLVRNPKAMATYLAGFRTYAYYHIQASKCYLHSKVLERIDRCYKDLTLAEIDSFTQK